MSELEFARMSKSRWFILLIFAAFALTSIDMPFSWDKAEEDGINWQPYATGIADARAQNKSVFLHIYAVWCQFCKKMAKETFRDDAVIQHLNANFISIRVDYDKEKSVIEEFPANGVPATYIINSKGQTVGPLMGYIPQDRLLAVLDKI